MYNFIIIFRKKVNSKLAGATICKSLFFFWIDGSEKCLCGLDISNSIPCSSCVEKIQ